MRFQWQYVHFKIMFGSQSLMFMIMDCDAGRYPTGFRKVSLQHMRGSGKSHVPVDTLRGSGKCTWVEMCREVVVKNMLMPVGTLRGPGKCRVPVGTLRGSGK